ncbi:unnamed protein product [Closterium sp. Naga37s-1]|nr:unnamed protein product [Closterium sp. Naga37s-1]
MRGNRDTAAGVVVCPLPSTSTPNNPKGAWITSGRVSLRRTCGVGVWSTRRRGPAMELEVEERLQEEVEGQEQRQPHKGRCVSTARSAKIVGGGATNDLSIGPRLHQATSMVARGGVMGAGGEEKDEEKGGKSEERKSRFFFFVNEGATDPALVAKIPVLPWRKSGKAVAAASMEESDGEEEQNGVQGEELIGGSVAVKHQQPVQIGLRLQETERSAVEEVQLHLEDLPGSELTSDHSGGGEQQGAGPAAEEGLEDESARLDSPSQLKLGATAKVTKRSLERGASPHGQQTATREKRVASATFNAEV